MLALVVLAAGAFGAWKLVFQKPTESDVVTPPVREDGGVDMPKGLVDVDPTPKGATATITDEHGVVATNGVFKTPGRVRVEFTARSELSDKLEEARQLLSHAIPSGDLGELMERALDALLEKEKRRRFGADRPRRRRPLKEGSRHVPVEVAEKPTLNAILELIEQVADRLDNQKFT